MNWLRSVVVTLASAIVFLSTGAVAYATTYMCYDGVGSSGWTQYGSFNVAPYGFDGSMYWDYVQSTTATESYGDWAFTPGSAGYYNYEVYIPDAYSDANAQYIMDISQYGTPTNYYIGVDQSQYSNQWAFLGQWYSDGGQISDIGLYDNIQNGDTAASIVGWDEAQIYN